MNAAKTTTTKRRCVRCGQSGGKHAAGCEMADGFDVTVTSTVGRVTFGDGVESPRVVAFELIGRYGVDGTFTFPEPDGSTCSVIVEHGSA